jgi:hypothetical protein
MYPRFDLTGLEMHSLRSNTVACSAMRVCKAGSNRLQRNRVLCHVSVRNNIVQTSGVCSMQTDKCRVFTGFDSKVQLKVRAPSRLRHFLFRQSYDQGFRTSVQTSQTLST